MAFEIDINGCFDIKLICIINATKHKKIQKVLKISQDVCKIYFYSVQNI